MKALTINHLEANTPPNSIYGCMDYFEQKPNMVDGKSFIYRLCNRRGNTSLVNKGERA